MSIARIKRFWGRLGLTKKLYLIFGGMGLIIFLELLTLKYSMTNLSAVRAFVYGESVWSKAQKDSAYYLRRYQLSKRESDFQLYRDSLFIPLECRKARLELNKKNPDMDIVRRGFINGKIHPDDVDSILNMIRTFSELEHIKIALRTWREADEILLEYEKTADLFHAGISNNAGTEKLRPISRKLYLLNLELGKAEDRFSDALQDGARWLETVVLVSLLLLVVIVEVLGFLLVLFFGRSLKNAINDLIDSSGKIARGEFTDPLPVRTNDEIGQLTQSVNYMSRTIQNSRQELEKKVAEAIKTRDEFYSIASHELKTPITAIQLSLQMLQRKLRDPSRPLDTIGALEYIDKSVDLSRKLTILQDTLMDVTLISGGLFRLSSVTEDLVPVIRQSMSEVSIGESVPISYEGPERFICHFDPIRLGQVFSNLLKNSLKYAKDSPVKISVEETREGIKFSVSDQGPGIPEELHKAIFEPFKRANIDPGVSGLGMGLYISCKILEAHGGTLSIGSSGSAGTTFVGTLPKNPS